jgi:histidyl-tRNA synthetase
VVILGEQELAAGQATVRDMTAREQAPVPLAEAVRRVQEVAALTRPPDSDDHSTDEG